MFWIELYLILQMSFWFVVRLGLNIVTGERYALAVLLGLGIKSFLLFVFVVLGLAKFIVFPTVFFQMQLSPLTEGDDQYDALENSRKFHLPAILAEEAE